MPNFNSPQHTYVGTAVGHALTKPAPAPSKKKKAFSPQINPGLRDTPINSESPSLLPPLKPMGKNEVFSTFKAFIDDLYIICRSTLDDPVTERKKDLLGLPCHGVTHPRMLEDGDPPIPEDGIYLDRPFIQFTNLQFVAGELKASDLVVHIQVTDWRGGRALGEARLVTLDKRTQGYIEHVSVTPLYSDPVSEARLALDLTTPRDRRLSLTSLLLLTHKTMRNHGIQQAEPLADICTVAINGHEHLLGMCQQKVDERITQLKGMLRGRSHCSLLRNTPFKQAKKTPMP